MTIETILYDVEDGILTITLNRPDRLNAFNNEMRDEVITALDMADADDDVKAIIFTGSGRAFCAGADLGGGRCWVQIIRWKPTKLTREVFTSPVSQRMRRRALRHSSKSGRPATRGRLVMTCQSFSLGGKNASLSSLRLRRS